MAALIVGYLLVGVLAIVVFLNDISHARQRIKQGRGTPSDYRAMRLTFPPVMAGLLMFLLALWWVAAIMYFLAGPDNKEDDPQDRVPPKYR